MRSSLVAMLGMAILLAGCATPETRLRTGLVNAGLGQNQAACMAKQMTDKLSLLQLRRLGSLGALKDANVNAMSTDQFLYQVRALRDPEILAVSISSAASCAFRG